MNQVMVRFANESYFDILETVKLEFDNQDINIPYPQMDVNLIQQA